MREFRYWIGVLTPTPGKSQVAIVFLWKKNAAGPLKKQLDSSGLITSQWRSVLTSVKYVNGIKTLSRSNPLMKVFCIRISEVVSISCTCFQNRSELRGDV